ncbi:MAG: hypothetical protein D6791_07395 [Chloroflexi bacterium]|nr:MAG: hypothetical protein D6791_07395 [Chloroflexota bacterium]
MNTHHRRVDPESVLRLLRQLAPRERLRVIAQVLPELEQELSPPPTSTDFWQGYELSALAEQQGVRPVSDFKALLGGWPEHESVDEFLSAIRQWRQQHLAEV